MKAKNYLRILMLLTAFGFLSACAPGMHMNENTRLSDVFSTQEGGKLDMVLITPKLVAKMNVNHIDKPTYLVGEQDILTVKVWSDVDLSVSNETKVDDSKINGLTVQNNGMIFYPYIGNISVVGMSIGEIRLLLTKKLSKYIANPQISVNVSEYRSKRVHIIGEVQKPGAYPITDMPMSVFDAIILGSINNRTANTEQIFVIRRASVKSNTIKPMIYRFNASSADAMLLGGQFYLNAGDVVFIPPAGVVSWNRVISNILPTIGFGTQVNSIK